MESDLELALELAEMADAITMHWFLSTDLKVESKADLTPVSVADRAVEQAWREHLRRERPTHAVLGEEFGATESGVESGSESGSSGGAQAWQWVLDPIDGTKNYVRGMPVWASLVALEHHGVPVLGVVSAPALQRRWWASRGGGAWESGRRLQVSGVTRVEDAFFSYDSLVGFEDRAVEDRWLAFARRCARSRGLGDFWSHVLVAEGAVDVAAEPDVAHWDMSAVAVIVEEAGGRFSDLAGQSRPDGGSGLSTNGVLHDEALAALGAHVNRGAALG